MHGLFRRSWNGRDYIKENCIRGFMRHARCRKWRNSNQAWSPISSPFSFTNLFWVFIALQSRRVMDKDIPLPKEIVMGLRHLSRFSIKLSSHKISRRQKTSKRRLKFHLFCFSVVYVHSSWFVSTVVRTVGSTDLSQQDSEHYIWCRRTDEGKAVHAVFSFSSSWFMRRSKTFFSSPPFDT